MRGSHVRAEPVALSEWLAMESADWKPSYPLPNDIRQPVIDALAEAQRGLCVYCGRKLDLSSAGGAFHVEHFRPQSVYPHLDTYFSNLFLSCGHETKEGNRSKTCGTAKDDWFDEVAHIEPEYPACTNRFRFSLTGEIKPENNGDKAAEKMILTLNLNHPELKREREEIQYRIDGLEGDELGYADFIDPARGTAESYAHMVCQRFDLLIP